MVVPSALEAATAADMEADWEVAMAVPSALEAADMEVDLEVAIRSLWDLEV